MNKRIIVIDDDEAIIKDYTLILAPDNRIAEMEKQAAEMEAALFSDAEALPGSDSDGEPPPAAVRNSLQEVYELSTALQGEEGFRIISEARNTGNPFALAFIDIRMPPGWDGIETARRVREADPDIEIVIVTAYSDRDRHEIVDKVGTPEKLLYLKKPFDPEEIRQFALSLTQKWDLEQKAERHRGYLERLLNAVRRLKTLSLTSIKGVLQAILNEVLYMINAQQGFVARLHKGQVEIEIFSEGISEDYSKDLVCKLSDRLPEVRDISQMDEVMVFPLKDLSGNFFILVLDNDPGMTSEKRRLLNLLLETCSDVLENVRKQEQYIKNERIATIGQIAAGIIHEVNNPLSAIVGTTEMNALHFNGIWEFLESCEKMTRMPDMPPRMLRTYREMRKKCRIDITRQKVSRNWEIIHAGIDRIHALMENIRNFSRVSDTFEPELNDVAEALESTLILAHNALKKGVTVHQNWKAPLLAHCDINGLRQVFLNLVLNAVQAMDGCGEIWIEGGQDSQFIRISIKDSGPGIPPSRRNEVFKAFFTTKENGTGLGLSIVKGIILRHGGTIEVASEAEEGARFSIELPKYLKPEGTGNADRETRVREC